MFSIIRTVSFKIPIAICDECHEQIIKAEDGYVIREGSEGPISIIHKACKEAVEKKLEFWLYDIMELNMYLYYLVKNLDIDMQECLWKAIRNDLEGK